MNCVVRGDKRNLGKNGTIMLSVLGMTVFISLLVKNEMHAQKSENHHFNLSETTAEMGWFPNRLLMLCYYKKLS